MAVCLLAFSAAASGANPVSYELKFERTNSHLARCHHARRRSLRRFRGFRHPGLGARLLLHRKLCRQCATFPRARPASGQELSWRKTDSQTWRVDLAGAKSVTVEYQVYANTLQNNIAQYNERHAFIGGPSVWMYIVGAKDRPATLSIAVPSGWRVATGMDHTSATTFQAPNYDTFADCPLEISDFAEKGFRSPRHEISRDRARRDGPERFRQVRGRLAKDRRRDCSSVPAGSRHLRPGRAFQGLLFYLSRLAQDRRRPGTSEFHAN